MFIEPTITRVPSGFSGYIWLDTKIVLKKNEKMRNFMTEMNIKVKLQVILVGINIL